MAEIKGHVVSNIHGEQLYAGRTELPKPTDRNSHESFDADREQLNSNPEKAIDPGVRNGVPFIDTTADKDEMPSSAQDVSHSDIVDWDSPQDPEKAMNWTAKKKWTNVAILSAVTLLTPLASSMIAPGIPYIMKDLGISSATIGGMVVSLYVLGFALGPLFLAPLSEMYGRLVLYHVCNSLFIVFNVACAVAPNVGALIVFRVLGGMAGSCPLTIGGGSVADLFRQSERGAAMAIWSIGPLLGPVIGPVAGGYLAQAEGWRWTFWLLAIAGGAIVIVSVIFQRETYEPVLLARRTARLRKQTNNPRLRSKMDTGETLAVLFKRAIVRPTKMLLFSPIVSVLSLYMAILYGYLYLLFTTITFVFEVNYHFSGGTVGLAYLGIGVGELSGLLIIGVVSDRLVKRLSAKGEMKPEYRLPPLLPGSFLISVGLFWYGWTAEKHTHWILPILGTMWIGAGIIATFLPISSYLVDAFTVHAASALAANTVLRSLVGAFLPLAGPKLYASLGLGWGNTLLGFIALLCCPISWMFFKYGERIRKSTRFQVTF